MARVYKRKRMTYRQEPINKFDAIISKTISLCLDWYGLTLDTDIPTAIKKLKIGMSRYEISEHEMICCLGDIFTVYKNGGYYHRYGSVFRTDNFTDGAFYSLYYGVGYNQPEHNHWVATRCLVLPVEVVDEMWNDGYVPLQYYEWVINIAKQQNPELESAETILQLGGEYIMAFGDGCKSIYKVEFNEHKDGQEVSNEEF